MWKNVKQKSNQKKKQIKMQKKATKKHQKKDKKWKTEKTKRIRLDLKWVKFYYNYYSYNCNPFRISRQS